MSSFVDKNSSESSLNPEIKETIPGFEAQNWFALMAPVGLSPEIRRGWNEALGKVLADPDVRKKLEDNGFIPMTGQTAEMSALIKDGLARWPKVIQDAKIKLNEYFVRVLNSETTSNYCSSGLIFASLTNFA